MLEFFLEHANLQYVREVGHIVVEHAFSSNMQLVNVTGIVVLWMALAKRLSTPDDANICKALLLRVNSYHELNQDMTTVEERFKLLMGSHILASSTHLAEWFFKHLRLLTP